MQKIAFVTMMLLGAACSQTSTDPTTSGYWLSQLDDETKRGEALRQLAKIKDPQAAPEVKRWLNTKGAWQADAASTLGALGDQSAVADLVKALDSNAGPVNTEAGRQATRLTINSIRALVQLNARDATLPLLKLVNSPAPTIREATLIALGQLKDERAVPALIEVASHETQPLLRKLAIQSLGKCQDARATDVLIKNLFVELPGISFYYEAREALVQIGQPAVPALLRTLQRQNPDVEKLRTQDGSPLAEGAIEAKAASVLGALNVAESENLITLALSKLFARYQQRGQNEIYASVPAGIVEMSLALKTIGKEQKTVNLLNQIARDDDPRLSSAATESLAVITARTKPLPQN